MFGSTEVNHTIQSEGWGVATSGAAKMMWFVTNVTIPGRIVFGGQLLVLDASKPIILLLLL